MRRDSGLKGRVVQDKIKKRGEEIGEERRGVERRGGRGEEKRRREERTGDLESRKRSGWRP
jgi:hypothetical protein